MRLSKFVKSTLREERARRALLFLERLGGCFAIEVLEIRIQAASGCDDYRFRFDHQFADAEYKRAIARPENLGVSWLCEYLVTQPADLRDEELDLSVAVPARSDTTRNVCSGL